MIEEKELPETCEVHGEKEGAGYQLPKDHTVHRLVDRGQELQEMGHKGRVCKELEYRGQDGHRIL